MKGYLNKNQIDYVLYHLKRHVRLSEEIESKIKFVQSSKKNADGVIFQLSSEPLKNVITIDDVPVLFPLTDTKRFYIETENGSILFQHDIIKSAFYLLSGYQETLPFQPDNHERFSYEESVQKKYNFTGIPLVNVYFNIIIEGIKKYCEINNLTFVKLNYWGNGSSAFMLTHDVDRIDRKLSGEIKILIKKILGIKPTAFGKLLLISRLPAAIVNFLLRIKTQWDFKKLKEYENELDINSTWFFLPQGAPEIDARHSLKEKRIAAIIDYLTYTGNEVALHGTYYSMLDFKMLNQNFKDLQEVVQQQDIFGVRQHYLRVKLPETFYYFEKLNLKYDSSLAFADHVGWRNSYCHPFKPYDFTKDKPFDIWELPLCVMDATLFEYHGFSIEKARLIVKGMMNQVKKFNGLFVLLWHNSFFNEYLYPGISTFYRELLEIAKDENFKFFTGKEIMLKLETLTIDTRNHLL